MPAATSFDRSPHRAMTAGQWGMLFALALLWAGSFFFVELALRELPPLTIVLARVGIAAVVLTPLVGWRAWSRGNGDGGLPWRDFAVMGLLNNMIPFSLIFWGQTEITAGLAAILNATTPLFTVVLAHFLTDDERLTPGRLAGVAVGIAGIAVMVGPAALEGVGAAVAAQAAVLGAAVSYALAGIFGRRLRRLPALTAAWGQVTLSTLLLAPVVLMVERPWTLVMPGAVSGPP